MTNRKNEMLQNDRRGSKTRGTLLLYLNNSMYMIEAAWNNFSKLKIKNQNFMEELSGILIGVNSIKEMCINKGMIFLAEQAEELEIALTELIDVQVAGDALLYQAIISKKNDLKNHILNLLTEYKNEEDIGNIIENDENILYISKNIFIISRDKHFTEECCVQIKQYGYIALPFTNFDNYFTALTQGKPAAIIIDMELFNSDDSHTLLDYHSKTSTIPMIAINSSSDFNSRHDAVKAGSVGFFQKPVNTSLLLDKLDSLISISTSDPFRVLVIDDSKTISTFVSRTLTRVGMIVHVETTAQSALAVISNFNPDLILMDMYMPVCDGEDLCRIIRQYESFTSIPIVFLSSETDVQKQLNAMKIGADDFLTKEIDPQHLVTSITTRIQRHRILSSFMIRDSLTGLLNHTTSKKYLEQMLIKAKNLNIPITFAMIDIDHFKKVNDNYGHPVGDIVIKSLSRLLQRRLRKTDSIGRYGGEEFAIALWDTNAINAKIILDDIRNDFSKIEHKYNNKTFHVTFSAGLAEYPKYLDSSSISNIADKALYLAKENGRNQIAII